jgi:hypothetical protein
LPVIERVVVERRRPIPLGVQTINLRRDPRRAPVRELPVELVPTLRYGERGMGNEELFQVPFHEGVPLRRRGWRRLGGVRPSAAADEYEGGEHRGQHQDGASVPNTHVNTPMTSRSTR